MALNGTITKNVGSYWRLRLYWTASQDVANNRSTVTSRLYWESTHSSYGAVYSSATKSGSHTVDGSTSSFTGSAGLSGGQSKLIHTKTQTINHKSDGTASFSMAGSFGIAVTLSGTYYGTVSLSGSATLNTIPRSSSLGSSTNWTAGNNLTVSVKRHSTSFRHVVKIYGANTSGSWVHIKDVSFSTSQTSLSSSFSTADHQQMYQLLAGRSSMSSRFVVVTYSGNTEIGESRHDGTITAEKASSIGSGFDRYVYIDEAIGIPISRSNSLFTHTVKMTLGSYSKTITSVGTSTTWTATASERNSLYAQTPNSTSRRGEIEITTYCGSYKVRDTVSTWMEFHVRNSHPTFTSSQIAYADTNSTTVGITGSNQSIIQSKSTFRSQIISSATPQNGASIKEYIVTVNGLSKTMTSTGYHTFGAINAPSNVTLSVKVIDSRGFATTVSKAVTMIPYSNPNVDTKAERLNGFEDKTSISLKGSVSPLKVGTSNKNTVLSAQFEYRVRGIGSYSTPEDFSVTKPIPSYSATSVEKTLDNQKAWDVRVIVKDRLGSTTINMVVPVGQPIFFIDSDKKSIGFNDYPKGENEFRVNGQLVFGANLWASGATGGITGGINMNNSDIVGINGMFFNDVSNNAGEGLLFLKSGATEGSNSTADYDNFYVSDEKLYLNNMSFMEVKRYASSGDGVFIGAGGMTAIGAGESPNYLRDSTSNYGWEHMYVTSDTDIHMMTNMQSGMSGSWDWVFNREGGLVSPQPLGVTFTSFGNIIAPTGMTSGSWSVRDTNGKIQLYVPLGSNTSQQVNIGQFSLVSEMGTAGDEESASAIVFREYSSTNKEFILVTDDTNGFYFNADQALPSAGNRGTGNGNLFAAKYNVVSDRKEKENIVEIEDSALRKIRGSKTYEYDHKMSDFRRDKLDSKGRRLKKSVGLIAQEAPVEITTDEGTGIDLYAMNTMLWKAVQELAEQVEYLNAKMKKR